jgi:hypothetical protein
MTKDNFPLSFINEINDTMIKSDLIMSYVGDFSQEITKTVLAMTERNFDAEGVGEGIKKKVFNVMVESLQNICKHQHAEKDTDGTASIFTIGETESHFLIISGNVIQNDKINNVQSRIDQINALDTEGLKALYKEVRLKSIISEVGGAGLGFIDMARKSGSRLEYRFDKINDVISFFTLLAKISNKE